MRIALVNPITKTMDRPKRVWSLFGRGGKETLLSDAEVNFVKLAQAMANLDHEVTLFISDCFKPKKPYLPVGNLKIRYLPTRIKYIFPPGYIPLLPTLFRELKDGKFDIVQTSDLFQPSTAMAALTCIRLFVWQEIDKYSARFPVRTLQKFYNQTIERWLRKKVSVIPRSQSSKNFLKSQGWTRTFEVIPTPVDTDVFKPIPKTPEEYLLVVTRLAPTCGLFFLLEVIAELKRVLPTLKWLIVGNGSLADLFQREVVERGLSSCVEIQSKFLSHQELNEVYNKSYMLLITTEGGLFPHIAFESMAAGKPVVSRLKRGLKDIVHDDQTGYLVNTIDEMVQKIQILLQDPKKRQQMGENARKLVQEYCDLRKVAARFIQTYKK